MIGDPPEQLGRGLDHGAVIARQVASPEHREGVVGERRRHVRTVRSAAWSRNRPRGRLAWLLVVILVVVIALAVRLDAAPVDPVANRAAIALAMRYADALTGVDPDLDDDDLDDDEPDDDLAERAELDADDEDNEPGDLDQASEPEAARASDDGDDDSSQPGAGEAQLALLEAEQAPPGDSLVDDVRAAAAPAGAAESYEAWMRQPKTSPWGRLDVALAFRHRASEPRYSPPSQSDELWLVATWRR
jgi:hypothetical protein